VARRLSLFVLERIFSAAQRQQSCAALTRAALSCFVCFATTNASDTALTAFFFCFCAAVIATKMDNNLCHELARDCDSYGSKLSRHDLVTQNLMPMRWRSQYLHKS
jgi:hypothetical protein